ncbi:MAG: MBL fold metallo-hydrolase [Oscillospiraceae bacterium]|nr:MBL fold metallo-hydrolase [Oscillospiraceae bacterium]
MATLTPLYSGSKCNATYIGGAAGGILIDAGGSAKQLTNALQQAGVDPRRVGAVFLTHEHTDHIAALRVFCRAHGTPVFGTAGTLRALAERIDLTNIHTEVVPSDGIATCGMLVRSHAISHDCAEPCAYTCEAEDGEKFAVATDLGYIDDDLQDALLGCDNVMLESNHEPRLVQLCDRPYAIKRRILSDSGHLSNAACAEFLPKLLQRGTARFWLAHLSRDNNTPDLALGCATAAFDAVGARAGMDYELEVCPS